MSIVTLDAQHDFGIRTRTNGIDYLLPVVQWLAIQGQQAITGLQACSLRRAFRVEFSEYRRQRRAPWPNPQRTNRVRLIGTLEPVIQCQYTWRIRGRALLAHQQLQRAALAKTSHQLQIDSGPPESRLAIDGDDFLACIQTGLGGDTARLDRTDDRAHLLAAEHGQHPEKHQRQKEIGHRAGGNNGDTLTHGFTVERLIELIDRDFAFTLVEHFDVAAQRDRGNHEFGTLLVMPAQQWHAEAYGKAQNLDATAPRDPEVAEFVEGDQHTQSNQGAGNHIERAHLLSPQSCSVPRAANVLQILSIVTLEPLPRQITRLGIGSKHRL